MQHAHVHSRQRPATTADHISPRSSVVGGCLPEVRRRGHEMQPGAVKLDTRRRTRGGRTVNPEGRDLVRHHRCGRQESLFRRVLEMIGMLVLDIEEASTCLAALHVGVMTSRMALARRPHAVARGVGGFIVYVELGVHTPLLLLDSLEHANVGCEHLWFATMRQLFKCPRRGLQVPRACSLDALHHNVDGPDSARRSLGRRTLKPLCDAP